MKRSLRICVVLAISLVLAVPMTALAQHDRTQHGAQSSIRGTVTRVRMVDDPLNRFRPRTATISRGDRVKWINRGNVTHTSTSRGVWDSGPLSPGESFRRRFRRVGEFAYRCSIHPEMTGTIVVVR